LTLQRAVFDRDALVRIPPPQPASQSLTHTKSGRARSGQALNAKAVGESIRAAADAAANMNGARNIEFLLVRTCTAAGVWRRKTSGHQPPRCKPRTIFQLTSVPTGALAFGRSARGQAGRNNIIACLSGHLIDECGERLTRPYSLPSVVFALPPPQGEVYFVQSCLGTGVPNSRSGERAARMLSASALSQTEIFFRSSSPTFQFTRSRASNARSSDLSNQQRGKRHEFKLQARVRHCRRRRARCSRRSTKSRSTTY
jgi:hypothetical protein